MLNPLKLFIPFTKREDSPDGSVLVEGIATAEEIDKQGEAVSYEGSKAAFTEWSEGFARVTNGASLGNIREMHGPVAAGKAIGWTADDTRKAIVLRARISDTAAAQKVRDSVYTGYSIGAPGHTVKREIVKNGDTEFPMVMAYTLSEVSIVDNPACPSASFSVVKRAVPDPVPDPDPATTPEKKPDPDTPPEPKKPDTPTPPETKAAVTTEGLQAFIKNEIQDLAKLVKTLQETSKDALAKAAEEAARGAVEKALGPVKDSLAAVVKRLEVVEATPAAPLGTKLVTKGQEIDGGITPEIFAATVEKLEAEGVLTGAKREEARKMLAAMTLMKRT